MDLVKNTYASLRNKGVAFTPDDLSFSAVVEKTNNFVTYNTVEGFCDIDAFAVENVDQFSCVLKMDVFVQRTVAIVLATPISLAVLIKAQQP